MTLVERRSQYYKKEIASLQVTNDALKAHINSLREALYELGRQTMHGTTQFNIIMGCFTTTPTQSLAEHDKKVIAEFIAKCSVDS